MSVTKGILLCILLACSVWCSDDSAEENLQVYKNFTRTLIDAYDIDTSFNHNFFSLLHIFCPESVFCPNESIQDEHAFFGGQNETLVAFSKAFFESRQPHITASSRGYLLSYQYLFKECCKKCSCDSDCVERSNCCPVKQDTDLTESERPSIKQECVYPGMHSDTRPTHMLTHAYFMVVHCFLDNDNDTIVRQCQSPNKENPDEIAPVYSHKSDRIYRNTFCAACNKENDVLPWQSKVFFNRGVSFNTLRYFSSPEKLYRKLLVHRRTGALVYVPTESMLKPTSHYTCNLVVKHANPNCSESTLDDDQKNFLQRACAYYNSGYLDSVFTYPNVFCYICREIKLKRNKCNFEQRDPEYGLIAILSGVVTKEENRPSTTNSGRVCECTEFLQKKQAVCREVKCPYGEYYVGCRCEQFLQNLNMRMKIFIELSPSGSSHDSQSLRGKTNNKIANAVKSAIKKTFVDIWGKISLGFEAVHSETASHNSSYLKFYVVFSVPSGDGIGMPTFKDMLDRITDGIPVKVFKMPMRIFLGRIFNGLLKESSSSGKFPDEQDSFNKPGFILQKLFIAPTPPVSVSTREKPSVILSKLLFCKRVILGEEESEVLKNASRVSGFADRLAYLYNEVDASMCIDDFQARFDTSGMPASSSDFRIALCLLMLTVVNVLEI